MVRKRTFLAAIIALVGFGTVILVLLKNEVLRYTAVDGSAFANEITMKTIGDNLMTAKKYGICSPIRVHLCISFGLYHWWLGYN